MCSKPERSSVSLMKAYLEFETPIAELEGKIEELRQGAAKDRSAGQMVNVEDEVARLNARIPQSDRRNLCAPDAVAENAGGAAPVAAPFLGLRQVACSRILCRSPATACSETTRRSLAGLGWFRGSAVAVVGQEKGNDTASPREAQFRHGLPEGYRKVQRLFELADQFGLPVLSLVRYGGRLSRYRCGGTRAGRSHRAIHRSMPCARVRLSSPRL